MEKIDIGQVLQDLYDSEINYALLAPCWDGGFTIMVGGANPYDETTSGYEYKSPGHDTLDGAIEHLIEKALEIFPDSVFSDKYGV